MLKRLEKFRGPKRPLEELKGLGVWEHRRTILSLFRTGPHIQ
jgi:hypothetical protein